MAGAAFDFARGSRNRAHPYVERGRDKGNVAAALAIVAIALGRDHADAAASLGEIEATAPEIGAAMATVLRLGGFIETPAQGDAGLGEAQAGEVSATDPPASISASSMQDS